ncbi:hypothetical protein EDF24_3578 [Curtobacterium sp. PhB130]|nr:hypothetical protein EDF55_0927 [Curtobacterium sp. ZW137]ROS71933.1 hypothetical protein EDF24_3578 [Curtobacterium sp. PhB130]TCK61351.1 hypothetical protein EDF27_3064 [Curtobacterium sp. PhB136]
MWIPGLILGPAAIAAGILLFIRPGVFSDLLHTVSRGGDEEGRHQPDLLKGPAIGLVWIGIAVLLVSVFLRPS